MNLLDGEMTPDGFRLGDDIALPCRTRDPAVRRVGVRPEHFRIAASGVPLAVKVIEPTGSETMISGRIGSQAITVLVRGRVDVLPGTVLEILPEEGHVHAFDAAGRRLDS